MTLFAQQWLCVNQHKKSGQKSERNSLNLTSVVREALDCSLLKGLKLSVQDLSRSLSAGFCVCELQ